MRDNTADSSEHSQTIGTSYKFTVTATNKYGTSSPSATSTAVTYVSATDDDE
ncbi:unannotated protein [freshwater metagenome]|jgi:hypothetical protein|uniref:Unannotated protein n=1 Tax=freshwater metagenome TaxID=449393 RepID=A0A6J7LKF4_9ZZZZ